MNMQRSHRRSGAFRPDQDRRDVSKVRVHELAKELGVSSKDVLAKLQELGEFVKSASSTVEAPVVRKLREAMPPAPAAEAAPAKTVMYFYGSTCPACKEVAPVIEKMIAKDLQFCYTELPL